MVPLIKKREDENEDSIDGEIISGQDWELTTDDSEEEEEEENEVR